MYKKEEEAHSWSMAYDSVADAADAADAALLKLNLKFISF